MLLCVSIERVALAKGVLSLTGLFFSLHMTAFCLALAFLGLPVIAPVFLRLAKQIYDRENKGRETLGDATRQSSHGNI